MYTFNESFTLVNDRGMPYSVTEEKIHQYTNPAGKAEDGRFFFAREGAHLILNTPTLESFRLRCRLGFVPPAQAFRKHISWAFYCGYNINRRTGKMLSLSYFEDRYVLLIQLFDVNGKKNSLISEQTAENVTLKGDTMYAFALSVNSKNLYGKFNDIAFSFACDMPEGKIAFTNYRSIKGLLFSDIYVESEEAPFKTVLDKKYIIPHYDGGSEDYCIQVTAKKYDGGTYEIAYRLTGGAYSRNTPDYKMGIWSVQYDIFTNPYISFYGSKNTGKLYLKNGELCFIEQNETFKNTELILENEKIPYTGVFYLDEFDENSDFAFGYDLLRRLGNELQEDKREFVYKDGELLYSGTPLSDDYIITVSSPADKKITTLIPKDIDKYEKALFHAQNNHYFMDDEDVVFKITSHIRKNAELTDFKLYLLDAFYNEIKEIDPKPEQSTKLTQYGFTSLAHNVHLGKIPQGVYHIKAEIILGSKVVCSHTSAFEVIDDSEISPRESSGIPFMYSGEAAPANIEYNCPDPWTIKPDHNEIHYLDCMLAVPEVTENRKGWEIMKLYKRKMFLWADPRTMPKGKTYKDYLKSVKLADYIMAGATNAPLTYTIFPGIFKNPHILGKYNSFKKAHPHYSLPDIPASGEISNESFHRFYNAYGSEWIDYICEKTADKLMEFQCEVRELNPNIKFSYYGPYALYGTRHAGILSSKFRNVSEKYLTKMMDGYWIFEDYPFITAQETHYSAWAMMGFLTHTPEANVVVELFGSFDPVCPDGFVFCAFPPMGGVYAESYRTVTQVYEHMYAAALMNGKFAYYKKPRFQFLQSYNTEAKQRFEEFLKGWGTYLKNKPAKPIKSPVFINEYTTDDDRFGFDFSDRDANNISQAGQAYLYGVMAEAGLPKGYCTNFDGILSLDETMTDMCVLPSLKYASREVLNKIRELSKKGVSLVAVSDISDLADIFGVEKYGVHAKVCSLENDTECEVITNRTAEFFYKAVDAEVLLWAIDENEEKHPVILKYGKNIIINSYICQVGCAEFSHDAFGIANVSKLLKKVLSDTATSVSSPLATADNKCGINLFETEQGEKRILLTDYTLCGNAELKDVTVTLNFDAENVECVCHKDMTVEPNLIKKNGKIKAFTVTLRPGESALFSIE